MPMTTVLRQRLRAQIRLLEERLRALDLVEQMEQELAEGKFPSLPASELEEQSVGTLTDTIGQLLPADGWISVVSMVELVRPLHPDVERSAVGQALRRLHLRGHAERRGTPRGKGYEYRRSRTSQGKTTPKDRSHATEKGT